MSKDKPKRIKALHDGWDITKGKIYDVLKWDCNGDAIIIDDVGHRNSIYKDGWEPVQDFQHGDPVWAWDAFYESDRQKAIYVGKYQNKDEAHVVLVEEKGITVFGFVEHRKPVQKTMTEIAEAFGTNVDNFEIIEE